MSATDRAWGWGRFTRHGCASASAVVGLASGAFDSAGLADIGASRTTGIKEAVAELARFDDIIATDRLRWWWRGYKSAGARCDIVVATSPTTDALITGSATGDTDLTRSDIIGRDATDRLGGLSRFDLIINKDGDGNYKNKRQKNHSQAWFQFEI